jgi:hypothetical protein
MEARFLHRPPGVFIAVHINGTEAPHPLASLKALVRERKEGIKLTKIQLGIHLDKLYFGCAMRTGYIQGEGWFIKRVTSESLTSTSTVIFLSTERWQDNFFPEPISVLQEACLLLNTWEKTNKLKRVHWHCCSRIHCFEEKSRNQALEHPCEVLRQTREAIELQSVSAAAKRTVV